MKKILVTGGAGFIGSNLCELLVRKGEYQITSLDNYSTGKIENHVEGVNYIVGDTAEISTIIKIKPDIVFHLGEYSRVEQSFEDIEAVFRSNKIGTFAVLEFVRRTKAKLIYAGSSTKFGNNGKGGQGSPYAWTKSSNAQLVINYGIWYSTSYAITYFYNAYGKNEICDGKYATLIGIYSKKMKNNEKLTIVNPGTQKRNFTNVADIVEGLLLVGEKGEGDGYGIGSDEEYTIIEVAEMFGGEIIRLPERKGNRMNSKLMTKKIKKLGWIAKNTLPNYIEKIKKNNFQTD
jgi:UDP-glucose 4-epimerase